jgi:SAM-dependent methyltransferase
VDQRRYTEPDDYKSFVLPSLLQSLAPPPKRTVLDLGPASGANVDQLAAAAKHHCKLFIANFFEDLVEAGPAARRDRKSFDAVCRRLLDFPRETRFDLVLAWDLFNYLDLEEIEVLASHLARYCRPGGYLMAMVSIYQQIPDRPFRFSIRGGDQLRYEALSRGLREAPRHNEGELVRCMKGFHVERAMLLRNGVQEYSFVVNAESAAD